MAVFDCFTRPRCSVPILTLVLLTALSAGLQATLSRASGVGISVEPDSILTTAEVERDTLPFHLYKVPDLYSPRAQRDLEFLWSDTYAQMGKPLVQGTGQNDLDRLGITLCNTPSNPMRYPYPDIKVAYDFGNARWTSYAEPVTFRDSVYHMAPADPGFKVYQPGWPDIQRTNVDTYLYMPTTSNSPNDPFRDSAYPNVRGDYVNRDGTPAGNYGMAASAFFWPAEDSLQGSMTQTYHNNSLMIPGPTPSQVGGTVWTEPDRIRNWGFTHEFQHVLNGLAGGPGNCLEETRSQLAVALTGALREPVKNDAPYDFSFDIASNYQAWQSLAAYLAYNFRGNDTTSTTLEGIHDDLAYRWSRIRGADYSHLGNCLSDAQCPECARKPYFDGLSDYDRACLFMHNWRVANYVNSYALADSQYGFNPAFGFSPAAHIGYWQNLDGVTWDDYDAIPPETTLTRACLTTQLTLRQTRRTATPDGWVYRPMVLYGRGAEYWVVRSDPGLESGNQDLVVRVTPEAALHRCWDVDLWGRSGIGKVRLYLTVIGYAQQDSAGQPAPLWRHGAWANQAVGPVIVEVDSLGSPAEIVLPSFGTTSKAALVVMTLEDDSIGTHRTRFTEPPILSYRLDLTMKPSGAPGPSPVQVTATPSLTEVHVGWSPTGNEIVFDRWVTGMQYGQIYRHRLDNGAESVLVQPAQSLLQARPDWSPRGDLVAYDAEDAGGNIDIWTYSLVTGEQLRLTTSTDNELSPCFSPNGQELAYLKYVSEFPGRWEIHRLQLDGTGDVTVLTMPPLEYISVVRWSPNGQRIYFVHNDSLYSVGSSGADIQAVDGGDIRYRDYDVHVGGGRFAVSETRDSVVCAGNDIYKRLVLRDIPSKDSESRFFARGQELRDARWSWDGLRVAHARRLDGIGSSYDVWLGTPTYNHAPQFVDLTDVGFAACVPFVMDLHATDADGEVITYQMAYGPPGATLAGNRLRWNYPQVGTYYTVLRALDPSGGVANQVVQMSVWDDGSCGGDLMAGSGGGGEGYSARRAEAASLRSVGRSQRSAENSLLGGVAAGEMGRDIYRLQAAPLLTERGYQVTLRQTGGSSVALDEAALVAVDHGPGTSVWSTQAGIICGTRVLPISGALASGGDVSTLINGSDPVGIRLTTGQSVVVNLGDSEAPQPVVLDCCGITGGPEGTGLLLEAPDGKGGWRTLEHCHPRQQFDELVMDSVAASTVRLTAIGEVSVRFVGRSARSDGRPTALQVPLMAALTRSGADCAAALGEAGGATTTIGPGDSLVLGFSAPPATEGTVRDWFLSVEGTPLDSRLAPQTHFDTPRGELPVAFALRQNEPNPFAQTTRIRFELPVRSAVKLELFDAQGRRVRTLASGAFEAGRHSAQWDRRDENGGRVRPGLYLCRIQAGRFCDQKKLVLLP